MEAYSGLNINERPLQLAEARLIAQPVSVGHTSGFLAEAYVYATQVMLAV